MRPTYPCFAQVAAVAAQAFSDMFATAARAHDATPLCARPVVRMLCRQKESPPPVCSHSPSHPHSHSRAAPRLACPRRAHCVLRALIVHTSHTTSASATQPAPSSVLFVPGTLVSQKTCAKSQTFKIVFVGTPLHASAAQHRPSLWPCRCWPTTWRRAPRHRWLARTRATSTSRAHHATTPCWPSCTW